MFGIRLIFILAVVGGLIAYLGDWLGTKIGKGRMSLFGLRPRHTSIFVAVLTGVAIAVFTIAIMAVSSEEARTALFGVKKLQQELKVLQEEQDEREKALRDSQTLLQQNQKELVGIERQLSDSRVMVWNMGQEVQRLEYTRDQLTADRNALEGEVQELTGVADALEKNISDLREGTVLVRSGQVLKTGAFVGGESVETLQEKLNQFMEETNRELSEEYKGALGGIQGLMISEEAFNHAITFLSQNEGVFAVRVLAAGNLYSGEPLMVEFDIFPNVQVYMAGEVIHAKSFIIGKDSAESENQVLDFLREVNEKAVAQGIKPDPIKGTVGAISLSDIYETVNKLKEYQGKVQLIAKAKQTIYSPGPVRLEIQIRGLRQ